MATFFGTPDEDEIFAEGSGNEYFGLGGDDILEGNSGDGSNILDGGEGRDELFANTEDVLRGNVGNDVLDARGGSGGNTLLGGQDNDVLFGGANDNLFGGFGVDFLFAGSGNILSGGSSGDQFWLVNAELPSSLITVTDFQPDVDVLGFSLQGEINSFDDLTFAQQDNGVLISYNDQEIALIRGIEVADLTTDNVLVAGVDPLNLDIPPEEEIGLNPPAPVGTEAITLTPLTTVTIGEGETQVAEIVAYDAITQRFFVTNSDAQQVEILDGSDPANLTLIGRLNFAGKVNSVTAKDGLIAVAVENVNPQEAGTVVFFDAAVDPTTSPQPLATVTVGALPDMVTFTPDGTKVLVANEGEPNQEYTLDPEGSISIIEVNRSESGINPTVTNVGFAGFNDQREALIESGVRIFGPGATVAQDLEPTHIAVSPDGSQAFITLQENNAIAILDIASATITEIVPLGAKAYEDGLAAEAPFSDFIVFGDSYSDTGNLFDLTGGAAPPTPPYFNGRSSNGLVTPEYLAQNLGLELDAEDNYAVGGAATDSGNVLEDDLGGVDLPGLADQIAQFTAQVGTGVADPEALYFLWVNANELYDPFLEGAPPTDAAITTAVENVVSAVTSLINLGAENIVVPLALDRGITPFADAFAEGATQVTLTYNNQLEASLESLEASLEGDVDIVIPDFSGLTDAVVNDPEAFGFTNATDSFLATSAQDPTADVEDYLFFDQNHITTEAHAALANFLATEIIGYTLDPSDDDGGINLRNAPVFGLLQPDGISAFEMAGETYYVIANEGDARDYEEFSEEVRVRDLVLDPEAFPNFRELQQDENLGRLQVTNTLGITEDSVFVSELTGSQEVPPVGTSASGNAVLKLVNEDDQLGYTIEIIGLDVGALIGSPQTEATEDDVTRLHFHNAARGENGAVVFSIIDTQTGIEDDDLEITITPEGGIISGVWDEDNIGSDALSLNDFLASLQNAAPGADVPLYLNVHTNEFPSGEIRGQVVGTVAYDELYAYGGRSFSVLNSEGEMIFDSGDDFERITATLFPELFNSEGTPATFDERSDNKGPEPESVVTGQIGDRVFAFIGLERTGGIMVYEVTNPGDAEFVQYIQNTGDLAPEGLEFISAADSPTGTPLLAVANEDSGTTTLYDIQANFPIAGNTAPQIQVPAAPFTLPENSAVGTEVGTVVAVDAEGDPITYSITGGNPDLDADGVAGFTISENGVITVADADDLDFETQPNFNLQVTVSDGELTDSETIQVNLTNVDENGENDPPVVEDETFIIPENRPTFVRVGTVTAVDPEGDDLTFSILDGNTDLDGDGTPAFSINDEGEIFIADRDDLDFENNELEKERGAEKFVGFELTVQATDPEGASDTGIVTIELINQQSARRGQNGRKLFRFEDLDEFNLLFRFNRSEAAFLNEIGLFPVEDEEGTINGLLPEDAGYLEAALAQAEVIFSSLSDTPNGFSQSALSRLISGASLENTFFSLYLVQDSTTNLVLDALASGETPPDVFFGTSTNSDQFFEIDDINEEFFEFFFEDKPDDGDNDFNDIVITIEKTAENRFGNQPQGALELIDLSDLADTETVEATFTVYREAAFDNFIGFYQVDNPQGQIDNLNPNAASVTPQEYLAAALNNLVTTLDSENDQEVVTVEELNGGSMLAPFILANGNLEELLDGNNLAQFVDGDIDNGEVYFPYMGVNSDNFDHIRLLADNTFGFEDKPNGGDRDYNDIVMRVDFTVV